MLAPLGMPKCVAKVIKDIHFTTTLGSVWGKLLSMIGQDPSYVVFPSPTGLHVVIF
jgi:hypothetical protein